MDFLQKHIDISNLSNFKTKASTKYFFEINSLSDVLKINEIKKFARENNLKVLFVGGGTNSLFAFDEFNGIVIKNSLRGYNYDENSKLLEVNSAEDIRDIALILKHRFKNDLWYRFIGLPGSIGGAVFGNAGCFGLETENNFVKCDVYNFSTGKIETISKKDTGFSYRNSIFKESKNYFLIKAYFDLSNIIQKYENTKDVEKFRDEIQPKGNSCGSFFKNPTGDSAGRLLEDVGLKGFSVGSAYLSEKHANFLMIKGDNGNYKDLLKLIKLAQEKVKEKHQIDLIPEVNIIKN